MIYESAQTFDSGGFTMSLQCIRVHLEFCFVLSVEVHGGHSRIHSSVRTFPWTSARRR